MLQILQHVKHFCLNFHKNANFSSRFASKFLRLQRSKRMQSLQRLKNAVKRISTCKILLRYSRELTLLHLVLLSGQFPQLHSSCQFPQTAFLPVVSRWYRLVFKNEIHDLWVRRLVLKSEIYGLWVRRLFLKAKFTDYGLLSMFFFIFQTFSLNFQRFTPQVRVSVEAQN